METALGKLIWQLIEKFSAGEFVNGGWAGISAAADGLKNSRNGEEELHRLLLHTLSEMGKLIKEKCNLKIKVKGIQQRLEQALADEDWSKVQKAVAMLNDV